MSHEREESASSSSTTNNVYIFDQSSSIIKRNRLVQMILYEILSTIQYTKGNTRLNMIINGKDYHSSMSASSSPPDVDDDGMRMSISEKRRSRTQMAVDVSNTANANRMSHRRKLVGGWRNSRSLFASHL